MPTFGEVCRVLQAKLEAARDVAPREAWELAADVAGMTSFERWHLETLAFPDKKRAALDDMARRRMTGEPLAQILGHAWFYGRRFEVTPDVLIPRPDTETLIEAVLTRVSPLPCRGVDVGVGTGCVIGTLLAERPEWTMLGVDISDAAAQVARANLQRLGVAERGEIMVNDGLEGMTERFNLIVSNPPYVTDTEWENLETDVKDFEPRLALTGGVENPDGLVFYRRLAAWGTHRLLPGGWLCVETGWQQGQAVRKLLEEQNKAGDIWRDIEVLRDLAGRERVVCARRY